MNCKDDKAAATLSTKPAAIRQRRLRERKRKGIIFIDLEVGASAVACLVNVGLLSREMRANIHEVRRAFEKFVSRAFKEATLR